MYLPISIYRPSHKISRSETLQDWWYETNLCYRKLKLTCLSGCFIWSSHTLFDSKLTTGKYHLLLNIYQNLRLMILTHTMNRNCVFFILKGIFFFPLPSTGYWDCVIMWLKHEVTWWGKELCGVKEVRVEWNVPSSWRKEDIAFYWFTSYVSSVFFETRS